MTRFSFSNPLERLNGLFVAAVMAAYIVVALLAGPDVGWDLRNYHFYNGSVFLHGGFEGNLFPSQLQSWNNPLLDSLTVFLIEHLRPVAATSVIAFLQSLTVPLLTILIRQSSASFLKGLPLLSCGLTRAAALLIGAFGAMTVSELGTSYGDVMVSLPLLLSLAALGQAFALTGEKAGQRPWPWMAAAGFCFGAAVGLKLTAAIFAPGFCLCFFCLRLPALRVFHSFACFGVAAVAGLLLLDGFWMWDLWQTTGNPLFPFLNGFFHSPWLAADANLLDDRFMARTPLDGLRYLLALALGRHPGTEVAYYDLRLVGVWALLPLVVVQAWRRQLTGWPLALMVFFYVNFLVWLAVFGIMRYAVPFEFLSGIVLMLALTLALPNNCGAMVLGVVSIALCLTTQTPQWQSHLDWHSGQQRANWFGITIPQSLQAPNQMFLMLSDQPLSFVIPFFRKDSQFVRMEGNLEPEPGTVLYEKRWQAIASHAGPFLTLSPSMLTEAQQDRLASYGLTRIPVGCSLIPTNTGALFACPLQRL